MHPLLPLLLVFVAFDAHAHVFRVSLVNILVKNTVLKHLGDTKNFSMASRVLQNYGSTTEITRPKKSLCSYLAYYAFVSA